MKKIRLTTLLGIAALVMLVLVGASCTHGSKKHGTEFDTIPRYTHEDTVRLLKMSNEFMECLKVQNVDSAIGMLHIVKDDTVMPLNEKERESLRQQFKRFPVLEYDVHTSEFVNPGYAILTYKYRFMDNPTDDPNYPVTLKFATTVKYYKGTYYLGIHNYQYIKK